MEPTEGRFISRKIRFRPNKAQCILFKKCFNAHRYFYNAAIRHINNAYEQRKREFHESTTCVFENCSNEKTGMSHICKKHVNERLPWNLSFTQPSIRKAILISDKDLPEELKWQKDVPYDTRQLAIKDAISAYHSAISNMKNGHIKTFKLGYKSSKNETQMCWVNHNAIKRIHNTFIIFKQRLKTHSLLNIRSRQFSKIPSSINHDFKIMRIKGVHYIVLSFKEGFCEKTKAPNDIVALDPGCRTFMTGYNPNGTVVKFGEQQENKIKKLQTCLDKYRSKRDTYTNSRKIRGCKNRCMKIENKIHNIVLDLHNHIASYLCKNFDMILLPEFGTSKMQTSDKLHSNTKRMLGTLSHYKFQQKMLGTSNKKHRVLYIVDESFTTQTCGHCGKLNNVGGKKIYKCNCGYVSDRDIHGARNILLKAWTEHGIK